MAWWLGWGKLNFCLVAGVNTSTEKDGQSLTEQQEVLANFRDGTCRLVIATSVAEEGLDVAKCNLIVKYNHVSNEIALVQKKGKGIPPTDTAISATERQPN